MMTNSLLVCAVAVILTVAALAGQTTSAQSSLCPTLAYDIRFQPIDVEPRSFFTEAGQTTTVTRSKKFPRIIVRAVDSNGNLDSTVNNAMVTVSSNDPTTTIDATTSSVRMHRGEAHFANITILNGDIMNLNFTAISDQLQRVSEDGKSIIRYRLPLHGKFVQTGLVTVLRQETEKFALQFLRTSSFVRYPLTPITVVSGIALPAIRLQVVTSSYQQFLPLEGLANNFSVSVGFASAPPAGTTLSGTLEPIVAGFATFDNLVIKTTEKTLPGLVFTLAEPILQTRTGPIAIDILRDNAHIAFDTEDKSFIYTQGQDFSGLIGTPFPKIQISVRDNMYRPASQRSGLIITASCSRASITNNVAGVVDGVAVFDKLLFYGLGHEEFLPYVLTFTAGTQQGFKGESIFTGIVELSTIVTPAYRFRFVPGVADAFFNGVFQKKQVVKDTVLKPPFRVELLRSDNTRDDTNIDNLGVSITVDNGKFTATSSVLQFQQGVAQSLDFKFTTTSIAGSYTVLSVTSTADPLDRLVTGRINVTNPVSNFDLRFQPYGASLFSAEDQSSFATIGSPLWMVERKQIDSTGSRPFSILRFLSMTMPSMTSMPLSCVPKANWPLDSSISAAMALSVPLTFCAGPWLLAASSTVICGNLTL